jgi:hypothetical protein
MWDADPNEVREAINNSNVPLAQKILTKNLPVLKNIFRYLYRPGYTGDNKLPLSKWYPEEMAVKAIFEGANAVLHDPTDVMGNWRLKTNQEWANESSGHLTGTNWRKSVELLQGGKKI